MLEECPKDFNIDNILKILLNHENSEIISKINEEYYYWDSVKYRAPKGVKPEDLGFY